ncbi:protein unc-93 homolog A-like [Styela clava]|uniref:protein unc-93 homolog A-like n=1 Tax=Styela clava TaxID=7725 RepID=UPI00193AA0F2|nr:protein unc-93 homolog A-like [Styela clava]
MEESKEKQNSNDLILRKGRRKLKILFYCHATGVHLAIATLVALQTLQTSINIKDDIGAISLTAAYITSIFFGVFCVPAVLRVFGPHVALVMSDVCYLLYCLANFYPDLVVLTIGGIISGIARALYLPSYTILVMQIASQCMEYSTTKQDGYYFNYFQSRFYGMVEAASIVGNILSYAILSGTKSDSSSGELTSGNTTISPNVTTPGDFSNSYQYCGVYDCQDPGVVENNIDQYVPPDQMSVYIFLTVVSSLSVLSVIMHAFIYPGLGTFSHKLTKVKERVTNSLEENTTKSDTDFNVDEISATSNNNQKNDAKFQIYVNEGFTNDENKSNGNVAEYDDTNSIQLSVTSIESAETTSHANYWSTLKATFLFLIYPRSLMLSVSAFHFGMFFGFCFADLTRAYASCVAGVEMTGLFAMTFGAAGMVSALLYGRLNFPYRRYVIYAGLSVLELSMYVACYLWNPNPDTIWMVYMMFIGCGIVKGAYRQNIVETYTVHFLHNKDLALSVYNVWFTAGLGVQYGLSTFMCVETKLYTQLGIFTAAIILFVLVEFIYMRGDGVKKNEKNEIKTKL